MVVRVVESGIQTRQSLRRRNAVSVPPKIYNIEEKGALRFHPDDWSFKICASGFQRDLCIGYFGNEGIHLAHSYSGMVTVFVLREIDKGKGLLC